MFAYLIYVQKGPNHQSSSFYAKKIFPLSKIAHNKQSKEYAETNPGVKVKKKYTGEFL